MIVVVIIGMLAGMALPKFMRQRDFARINTIYTNLRVVETAKEEWALENKKKNGDTVGNIDVLTNYFRSGALVDVVQEMYVPNAIGTPAQADLPASVGLGPYAPGSSINAP
jgi:type II secretory pathway pseudopilin PulG